MKTLVLGRAAIVRIINEVGIDTLMDQTIERLEKALLSISPQADILPVRAGFSLQEPFPGIIEWMPYHERGSCITIKVVSYSPLNPTIRGVPTILATVSRFDASSGSLQVLCDGLLITALRTGAASAVATRHLAILDARIMGMVGAGAQAVAQVHALSRVLPLEECIVYDVDPSAALSFLSRSPVPELRIRVAALPELLAQSDVICTATSVSAGAGPVIKDEGLLPHVHINAVGSDLAGKTELPPSVLRRSLVCPDTIEQALREGECQQLVAEQIGPDLFTLVRHADSYASWRFKPTVFDSTGCALQDHIALDVILDAAKSCDVGDYLELQAQPSDALNPYNLTDSVAVLDPEQV